MQGFRIFKQKSFNISVPKPDYTTTFALGSSLLARSHYTLFELLLRSLLKVATYAKVSVTNYNSTNILLDNDFLFKHCSNLKKIEIAPVRNDYPRLFVVFFEYDDLVGVRKSKGSSFSSQEEATFKAFGEYLERFYGLYSDHHLKYKSRKKLYKFVPNRSSLQLPFLPKPTSEQKNNTFFPKNINDLRVLDASLAFNSTKNKKELLPLLFLYYGFTYQDMFLQPATTNGAGGGFSLEKARLSAVYELIERDHFLLFWVTKTKPDIIRNDSLPRHLYNKIRYFEERYNISIYILDTTYQIDIFSCVVFVVDNILHRASIGASAGVAISYVIEKALTEAVTEIHFSKTKNPLEDFSFAAVEEKPFLNKSISKNIRKDFYNNKEGISLLKELFLSGGEKVYESTLMLEKKFSSEKEELVFVENSFRNLSKEEGDGYNLYFFEYGGDLLESFDYFVSKAFVPSFLKLWLEEANATPLGDRVKMFCKDNNKVYSEKELNPYPHPLS